jgi:hypothetical protein
VSEEAAQPVEGQGAETPEGNDLYASFLDGVPNEIHDQVIPALKAQDAEFTKRFQSLSERTKPFEEAGVFERDVDEVGSYLQLAQALEAAQEGDGEAQQAVYDWWDSIGDTMGFYEADGDAGAGEEVESFDDEDFDPYNRNQLAKMLQEQVAEQIGPIAEFVQQQAMTQQEQQALSAAEAEIEGQIEQLRGQHDLSDEVLGEVLELAEMFVEADNPIQAGFEKYQSLVGKGEANLFNDKVQQPNTPEGSGPAATTPEAITSANVKDKVLERLNQQKSLTG